MIDKVIIDGQEVELTKDMLEQLGTGIEEAKKNGSEPQDMRLTYKKVEANKNML